MSFDEILDMSWQNLNQYFVELSAINDEIKKDIEDGKSKDDNMSFNDLKNIPGVSFS